MARLLSNMAFRSIIMSSRSLKIHAESEGVFRQSIQYSTWLGADWDTHEDFRRANNSAGPTLSKRISSDSDTHEDFRSSNYLETSYVYVQDVVSQDIRRNPVMIYMKGLPNDPRCGFSVLAVKVLQQYGVPIGARDILGDLELKVGLKAYSNWPTFPQIFIKGEFIGGADIVLSMHQNGELKDLLADITDDRKEEEFPIVFLQNVELRICWQTSHMTENRKRQQNCLSFLM